MNEPGDQLVIHEPLDGETLNHYLERYSTEEFQKIFQRPDLVSELSSLFINTPWRSAAGSSDRSWERIWDILQRTDNFEALLHHIDMWKPNRRKLLELLNNSPSELRKLSKFCAGGRFIGCALESGSIVAGLFLEDTVPNAKWLLTAGKVFGALALGSTFLEIKESRDIFGKLEELVERDQKSFAPIQNWYKQTEKLEKAMTDVFPFDFTEEYVKELIGVAEEEIDQVKILERLLIVIAETDQNMLRDGNSLQNIIKFITSPKSIELFKWIIYHSDRHPLAIDVLRMFCQSNVGSSSINYLCCLGLKSFAPIDQSPFYLPVAARILLNCYSCADALKRFGGQEVPGTFQMQALKRHLERELNAVMKIINIGKLRNL